MREGPEEVYIRHRSELLKAITENHDPSQEVGDYLLSVRNLENHGISFDMTSHDTLCMDFSNDFLKSQDGEGAHARYRPALIGEEGTRHPWRGAMKMAWDESDNEKHGVRLFRPIREGETFSEHKEKNKIPLSMKHGLFPETLSATERPNLRKRKSESILGDSIGFEEVPHGKGETTIKEPLERYAGQNPFDATVLPIRKINPDSGKPAWYHMMKALYRGKDKWAERIAAAEKKHKNYWRKKGATDATDGLLHRNDVQDEETFDIHSKKLGASTFDELDDHVDSEGYLLDGDGKRIDLGSTRLRNAFDAMPGSGMLSFLGGDFGHESEDTEHLHGTRMRDFESWKKGTRDWAPTPRRKGHSPESDEDYAKRVEEHHDQWQKRIAEIEASGIDLEDAHFEDRMDKNLSDDVWTEWDEAGDKTIIDEGKERTKGIYEDWEEGGLEALLDKKTHHAVGLGLPSLLKGMEWLSPKERTLVMEHGMHKASDDPEEQYIELEDGKRLSMARIKTVQKQRLEPLAQWWARPILHPGPNVPANVEATHDGFIHGEEGSVIRALNETYIKDGAHLDKSQAFRTAVYPKDHPKEGQPRMDERGVSIMEPNYDQTAYEYILDKLEEAYEGDSLLEYGDERHNEAGEPIGRARGLPLFQDEHLDDILSAMSEHGDAKKAIAGKLHGKSDVGLTSNGLLHLLGWNRDMTEKGAHPLFPEHEGALISKDLMRAILREQDLRKGVALSAKPIRNSLIAHHANHGPMKEDIPEEEHGHFLDVDGRLMGLGFPQGGRIFAHEGGLGRTLNTFTEMMHDFFGDEIDWARGEATASEVGTREAKGEWRNRETGQVYGASNVRPRGDTIGLWGRTHPNFLPFGHKYHDTPHGIISMTDTNAHGLSELGDSSYGGRNVKMNDSLYTSTRSPYFMARFRKENPDAKKFKMLTSGLDVRSMDEYGFMNSNFATKTSSSPAMRKPDGWTDEEWSRKNARGDFAIRNHAALARMIQHANGRNDDFSNPRQRLHTTVKDVERDATLLGNLDMDHIDYMEEMPFYKVNPKDRLDDEFFDVWQDAKSIVDNMDMSKPTPEQERALQVLARLEHEFKTRYGGEVFGTKGQSGKGRSSRGFGKADLFENIMREDKEAHLDFVREVCIPAVLEKHPNAFDIENPKALTNLAAIVNGAVPAFYKATGHGLTTTAANVRPIKVDTASDLHYTLANALRNKEVGAYIEEGDSIPTVLDKLGLPDDPAHRKEAKHLMDTHGGDFSVATLAQLASSGIGWNPEEENTGHTSFADLKGLKIQDHLDEELEALEAILPDMGGSRTAGQRKAIKSAIDDVVLAWNRNHGAYRSLNWLKNIMYGGKDPVKTLQNYGLTFQRAAPASTKDSMAPMKTGREFLGDKLKDRELLFPAPKPKSNNDRNMRAGRLHKLNTHKRLAHSMLVFNEGAVQGEGLTAAGAPVDMEEVGFMQTDIMPHDTGEGAVVNDHFCSGGLDTGTLFQPEVGITTNEDDEVIAGTNPGQMLLHPLPYEGIQRLLPNYAPEHIQTMLDNHQSAEVGSNDTRLDEEGYGSEFIGVSTGEEMEITDLLLKEKAAVLPKQVPLIEPLHRIFDVKDLKQLRGFTGEWVVSVHKDGKRCKVQCKKNRVTMYDENGNKQSMGSDMRSAFKKLGKKNYVVDGVLKDGEFFVSDILLYDDDVVYDLSTRERIKVLRGQFDSYDPVHIPSPSDIRITDDVGLENAVKELSKLSDKLLLRDAKSTYMKGEEKHPKWVLLAKSDVDFHIPFSMEIDDSHFVIHLPEDLVKYDIVDGEAVEPVAAIGSVTNSDYSLRLAKSLEPYWKDAFAEMLKEETEIEPEIDEERIEEESGGILRPKKDKNLILKPKDVYKTLVLIERIIDRMEKGHSNMAGRGLGIDVGGDGTESPRGPTSLNSEESLPDWDMRKRPKEDMEKPEDYPGRKRKAKKNEAQSNELAERSLER